MIAMASQPLAKISEVEPALGVEYDVVRGRQPVVADLGIERPRLAGFRIDALDVTEFVVENCTRRRKKCATQRNAALIPDGSKLLDGDLPGA